MSEWLEKGKIEGSLVNRAQARKDLLEYRKKIDKALTRIHEIEKENYVWNDLITGDNIDKLNDLFAEGRFEELAKACHEIHLAINSNLFSDLEKTPEDQIKEIVGQKKAYPLPMDFGLNDIHIMPGVNVVVGARSGYGKTSFGLNMVLDFIKNKKKVVFFSLEMTPAQLWLKLFQLYLSKERNESISFIALQEAVSSPKLYVEDHRKLLEFVAWAKGYLVIINANYMSAGDMADIYEQSARKFDAYPEWAVVDYLQLIEPEKHLHRATVREKMIAISQIFATKAKERQSNFLLLSQVNNDDEFRESKKINDDAGMSIILERDIENNEFAPTVVIKIKKSRFTRIGVSEVPFSNKTGAIG